LLTHGALLKGAPVLKYLNISDAKKLDLMLHETERNRQMISQILCTTFKHQEGDKEMLVDRGPEVIN